MMKLYCISQMNDTEGYYLVRAYEGGRIVFTLEGSESYTRKERIGLMALKDAVVSIQDEGGVIYTDSAYALDCILGGDHRKNKDIYKVLKSAMSRRIRVEMVNKSEKRYLALCRRLKKCLTKLN